MALTLLDRDLGFLLGGVLSVLLAATLLGLSRRKRLAAVATEGSEVHSAVARLNAQIGAWWAMCAVFLLAVLLGPVGSVALFGLVSFLALREFITMTPTRASDHSALAWVFFVITPLQYVLVAIDWYGLYSILIPVYAFLFIPIRIALEGDRSGFLERTATVQWGLMICVYCLSHAPALLGLAIPGYTGQNAKLLVFFVLLVQVGDVLAYAARRWVRGKRLAPRLNPGATWAAFFAAAAGSAALGAALAWVTPFTALQAAFVSALVAVMGFAGRLTLSVIRRDRGLGDPGSLLEGQRGVLARIDSLCFAAPVFFHVTRYLFAESGSS